MSRVVALHNRQVFFTTRGTQVNLNQTGVSQVNVHSGGTRHAPGSMMMVAGDPTRYARVNASTATKLTLDRSMDFTDRDMLVNLGADTGSASPNYDGYIGSEFIYQISEDKAGYEYPGNKTSLDQNGRMNVYVLANSTFDYWVMSSKGEIDANAGLFPHNIADNDPVSGADFVVGDLTVQGAFHHIGGSFILDAGAQMSDLLLTNGLSVQGNSLLGDDAGDLTQVTGNLTVSETAVFAKDVTLLQGITSGTGTVTGANVTASTALSSQGTLAVDGVTTFNDAINQTSEDLSSLIRLAIRDHILPGGTGFNPTMGYKGTQNVTGAATYSPVLRTDERIQDVSLDNAVYTWTVSLPVVDPGTDGTLTFRFILRFAGGSPTVVFTVPTFGTILTINPSGAEDWTVEVYATGVGWDVLSAIKHDA
jgi:hypothetical protein